MRERHSRGVSARQLRFAPPPPEEKEKGRGGWATTKSSRARKQPAQWLSAGATTKKNDESSSQLKRLEIKMFCANTRGLKLLDPKECGAVLAADAVNERAKESHTADCGAFSLRENSKYSFSHRKMLLMPVASSNENHTEESETRRAARCSDARSTRGECAKGTHEV